MLNIASAQEKQHVKLSAGTPVMLEVVDTISSDSYASGQTVLLVVSRAVSVDDQVVILHNTEVYAKVSEAEKASGWGSEGKIAIVIESTYAVDGQEIMLSATQQSRGISDHGTATAVGVGTGLLCLPLRSQDLL